MQLTSDPPNGGESMLEDAKRNRYPAPSIPQRQNVPGWTNPATHLNRAIQALSTKPGRAPRETKIPGGLRSGLTDHARTSRSLEDREIEEAFWNESGEAAAERMGGGRPSGPSVPQKGSFPTRLPAEGEASECLPDTASDQKLFRWTISVPQIERAVHKLNIECGHAPTEAEIAAELHTDVEHYRERLDQLKDLEMGILLAQRTPESSAEWIARTPQARDGDFLFRCLRAEMQLLFRSTIRKCPKRGYGDTTLYYSVGSYEKSISVTVELPNAAITNYRTRFYLSVRATLPNPCLGLSPGLRGLPFDFTHGGVSTPSEEGSRIKTSDYADVTVHGSQTWSTSSGQFLDGSVGQESWSLGFRSWYSLDDKQNLTEMRRQENYHVTLEL